MNTQPKQSASLEQRALELLASDIGRAAKNDDKEYLNILLAEYAKKKSALSAQPRGADGEVEELRGQMEIVWRYLQKVSPWSPSNDMLWCDEIMLGIDRLITTTPQDAAGVEQPVAIEQLSTNAPLRHSERADAEQAYTLTAFDYVRAPVGTHDWQLYWRGWWHRSQLYTTPPPGVDVGKLRELVEEWRADASKLRERAVKAEKRSRAGVPVPYDALELRQGAQDADGYADELAAIIDAAAPGVQT